MFLKDKTNILSFKWQKRHLSPKILCLTQNTGHERYCTRATQYIYRQHIFSDQTITEFIASHIFDLSGKKQSLDKLLSEKNGSNCWSPALNNK